MEKIEWSESFSVGNAKLDEQHKTIIKMINKLVTHDERSNDSETVHVILNEMMRYCMDHLTYEEQLMDRYDYADKINHKYLHVKYIEKFSDLSMQAMRAGDDVSPELTSFLSDWWVNHILVEDMKYKGSL